MPLFIKLCHELTNHTSGDVITARIKHLKMYKIALFEKELHQFDILIH